MNEHLLKVIVIPSLPIALKLSTSIIGAFLLDYTLPKRESSKFYKIWEKEKERGGSNSKDVEGRGGR